MATATTAEATVSERLLFLIEKQLSKNCIYDEKRCLSGGDIAKLVDIDVTQLKNYRYGHFDLFDEYADFYKGEFGYIYYTRSGFLKFKPYVSFKYNRRSSYNNYNSGYNSRHETVDIVFDTILEKYFDVPVSVEATVTDAVVEDTDTTNKESEEMGSVENTATTNEAVTFTTVNLGDFLNETMGITSENMELVKSEKFGEVSVDLYRKKDQSNDIWFTKKQIGEALEYADPQNAIDLIYKRNTARLQQFSVTVKLTGTDGKSYNTTLFNRRGVMEICRYSKQPKANLLYDWIYDIVEAYMDGELKSTKKISQPDFSNLSNEDAMLYILLKEEAQNKIIGDLIQSQQNWMAVQQKHNEEFRKEIMSYFKEFGDGIAKTVSDFVTQQMNNSQNLNTTISNALECVQKNSNSHTSSIENMCESLKSIVSGIGQITATTTSSSAPSESADTNKEETKNEEATKADYDPAWRNRTLAWANMYAAKHGISNANLVLGNMYSAIDNKYNVNIRKLRSEYVKKRMLTRLSVIDFIATFRKTRDIFDEIVKGIMEVEEKEEQVHQNNNVVQNQVMNSQNTATETKSIYKAQNKKMQNYNTRYERFCQLKNEGMSMTEIAKLLGLSYRTLFAYTYNGRYDKEHELAG